jgi:CheY-like chemotaxis protein
VVDIPEGIALAKIRVVLADAHQPMIAIVRQALGEEFEVVGVVEDGKQAVNSVLTLNPDALVIDISMPILDGFQAAKQLQTTNCRTKVIFLGIYESDKPTIRPSDLLLVLLSEKTVPIADGRAADNATPSDHKKATPRQGFSIGN